MAKGRPGGHNSGEVVAKAAPGGHNFGEGVACRCDLGRCGILCGVSFPRLTGLALVALGAIGTVVGLAMPWARSGVTHPDGATIAGLILLVPLLSGARVAIRGLDRRGPSIAAGIAALAGAVIALGSAHQVPPDTGVAAGGPLTVAGALTATLGWLVVQLPVRTALPPLVSAGAVVAVLALDLVGVAWGTDGRFVDSHTGSASAVPASSPDVDGERWQRTGPADRLVSVAGAQLFVHDATGVLAYATQTGRPTWQYRRSDLPAVASTVAGDVVVTAFGGGDILLVTARDRATGAGRFTRWYGGKGWRPTTLVSTPDGRAVVLAGHGVDAGDVVVLDAHTGDPRWTWPPVWDGGPCDVNGVAVADDTLAVALRCRANGVEDVVVGLSTPDGRERWAWQPSYDSDIARGDELAVTGLAGGVQVQFGSAPRHAVFLAADGVAGPAYGPESTGIGVLAGIVGTVAVYYDPGTGGADITAVNARDGSPAWHTRVPSLIGWQLVAMAAAPARAYLLLTTRQPETASGPLHVVALDRDTGAVLGDHGLACGAACQQSTIAADDHSVAVAAHDPAPHTTTLIALS